jgi:hypothetical protein
MKSDSEKAVNTTSVYYLTLPVESSDQATSLANYLNAHGVEAVSEGVDGVTCPITEVELAVDIHGLCESWRRFWKHSDAEVFGLSVYVKTAHAPVCSSSEE